MLSLKSELHACAFDFVIFEFVLSNLLARRFICTCFHVFIVFLFVFIIIIIYSHNSTIDNSRREMTENNEVVIE